MTLRSLSIRCPAVHTHAHLRCRATSLRRSVAPVRATTTSETTVRSFYEAVNAKQLEEALSYVSDDCRYEDLNFPTPFCGKEEVRELLAESIASLPSDFAFVIDDVAPGPSSCGVTWHVELGDIPFPFGRGVSFVRLSPEGKLQFVRDIPEPSTKPGAIALRLITVLSSLLRRFPGALASAARTAGALPLLPAPPSRTELPALPSWLSPTLWIGFTSYLFLLILGKELPGQPVYEIQGETLQAIADQSLSFFYVLPALSLAGVVPQSDVPFVHPTELALFNAVEAFTLLFLPLLAADARAVSMPVLPAWASQMFATNLVLLPWCAVRASQPPAVDVDAVNARRFSATAEAAIGAVGLVIGAASVAWFALAPLTPDASVGAASSLSDRWEHIISVASTDRLTLAFIVDLCIYSVVQPWLIGDERKFIQQTHPDAKLPLDLRFIPLFGAAHWLMTKPRIAV